MIAIIKCAWLIALAVTMPALAYPADYSRYAEVCEPYREAIEHTLAEYGVPAQFFFLMAAESHCNPDAVSPAGAVGIWQMMPRTAAKFGCSEPLDVACETRAAAAYLAHLLDECGEADTVYCWHDGGHNFKRKKTPSPGARALRRVFEAFANR